jgi:hypothetical protein
MINLRAISEKALGTTLEGVWGGPVGVISPLTGKTQNMRGQIVHEKTLKDPATGAVVKVEKSTVTLRRSSFDEDLLGAPVPTNDDKWFFTVPLEPTEDSATQTMTMETDPKNGRTIGFMTFHLTIPEQL